MIEKMFSREKTTGAESYLDRAKKYGTMIVPALALFLASCSGPEKPTPETIRKYFKENENAEKVTPNDVQAVRDAFTQFKDYSQSQGAIIDDRLISTAVYNKEKYPDHLDVDEWRLVDDSTIIYTYFNPVQQQIQAEHYTNGAAHQVEYILRGNGDIEMATGNLLEDKSSSRNEYCYIDGTTGGVVAYHKSHFSGANSMRITKDATLEKQGSYIDGDAAEFSQDAIKDLSRVIKNHQVY